MGKRKFEEDDDFYAEEEEPQGYFSTLFENSDCCPVCDSGPLLLRANGYVCPNSSCRKLVFKHEDV